MCSAFARTLGSWFVKWVRWGGCFFTDTSHRECGRADKHNKALPLCRTANWCIKGMPSSHEQATQTHNIFHRFSLRHQKGAAHTCVKCWCYFCVVVFFFFCERWRVCWVQEGQRPLPSSLCSTETQRKTAKCIASQNTTLDLDTHDLWTTRPKRGSGEALVLRRGQCPQKKKRALTLFPL